MLHISPPVFVPQTCCTAAFFKQCVSKVAVNIIVNQSGNSRDIKYFWCRGRLKWGRFLNFLFQFLTYGAGAVKKRKQQQKKTMTKQSSGRLSAQIPRILSWQLLFFFIQWTSLKCTITCTPADHLLVAQWSQDWPSVFYIEFKTSAMNCENRVHCILEASLLQCTRFKLSAVISSDSEPIY